MVQPIINCPRLAVRNSSWICDPHISPRSAPVNSLRVAHWELCCTEITAGKNRKFRDCCPGNGYCKATSIYYHKWLGYVGMETMLKCQVCAIGLPHYGACLPLLLEVASELSGPSPSVTGTIRHLRKRWTNRSTLDLTGCVCHTISRTGGRGREYIEASGCAKAGLEQISTRIS